MAMTTVKEFLKAYKSDVQKAVDLVWVDWFCSEKALVNRTKNIVGVIKKLAKEIDISDWELTMQNRCPCNGGLYDQIFLCPSDGCNVNIRFYSCYDKFDFQVGYYDEKTGREAGQEFGTNDRKKLVDTVIGTINWMRAKGIEI